jgi:hypothetical protein
MSDTIEAICVLFNKLLKLIYPRRGHIVTLPIDGGLPIEELTSHHENAIYTPQAHNDFHAVLVIRILLL